jgi:hypothetical protein
MRRGVVAAVVGVVALGCGSANSATTVLTQAAARTATAKSTKVFEQVHIAMDGQQEVGFPTDVQAEGAVDFGTRQSEMTLHFGTLSLPMLLDGHTLYEKLPATNIVFGDKRWVKADLVAIGNAMGRKTPGNAFQGPFGDPTTGLQFLRGISGAITKVGAEAVRGEPTTHYRAIVDPIKAAINAPDGLEAYIQQLVKALGSKPIDAWVDSQGRVRRIRLTLGLSAIDASSPIKSMDVTTEFYEFGTPVSVTVPPADQVFDLTKLFSQLGLNGQ